MAERIPQSATIRVPLYAVLSSDHVTPATGKTIAITISKNGAAFGNPSAGATNATEIANGWYYVDMSTTDTGTVGPLIIRGAVSGVDDSTVAYIVAAFTDQSGDAYARLGAPAGASISADVAAVKTDTGNIVTTTNKFAFTVANQVDCNVLDWKSATAPAMTGDAYARLGAPAGASVSADIATVTADVVALPSAATIASTVWSSVMETGYTALQGMRLMMSALLGKASGLSGTTATFRDVNDTTNRIVATVDASGDRSAVTLSP